MQEFFLVIYRDLTSANPAPTPEQMKEALKPYQEWVAGIAAQNRLVTPPRRWDADGRVIRLEKNKEQVYNGPYAEGKESIGGLLLVKAKDYDDAVAIARGCPIIRYGAIVEVRMALPVA